LPVRAAILQRKTYEAPAEGRANKVRLDFNENTTGCSPAVRKALARVSGKDLAMYPEYAKPTERIARYLGVRAKELLLANGGDDALRVFFDTFAEPGSEILICEPTFPMYRYYAEIAGAKVVVLRYGANMEFPLAALVAALQKKPRLLFVANPNNPTGTLIPPTAIRTILNAATHTAVVIDEAYFEFSGASVISEIHKYPNLFVVRTFSKAAGLAALRLGAVIAQPDSLALLRRAMPPFPVNLMAIVAAEAALKDRATIARYVRETMRIREALAAELKTMGVRVFPSAGNFLLADFGALGTEFFSMLAGNNILVRERTKEIGAGFVRISIGTASEMKRFLQVTRRFAERIGGSFS
jgi:histidinol-phosphate aminotransferase